MSESKKFEHLFVLYKYSSENDDMEGFLLKTDRLVNIISYLNANLEKPREFSIIINCIHSNYIGSGSEYATTPYQQYDIVIIKRDDLNGKIVEKYKVARFYNQKNEDDEDTNTTN